MPLLTRFRAWLYQAVHSVLPRDTLGIAVNYALKHWDARTPFTKAAQPGARTILPSAACTRRRSEER